MTDFSQFKNIFVTYVKYKQGIGERPVPICLGILNTLSNETFIYTENCFEQIKNNSIFSEDSLVVSYNTVPFLKIVKEIVDQYPKNIVDLAVEHRRLTNGLNYHDSISKNYIRSISLTHALKYWIAGLDIDWNQTFEQKIYNDSVAKKNIQEIIDEIHNVLLLTSRLFFHLRYKIGIKDALGVGYYLKVCAEMESNGIPIDVSTKEIIKKEFEVITDFFRKKLNRRFPVFREDGTLSYVKFTQELEKRGIKPIRTRSGFPALSKDVLESYSSMCSDLKDFEIYNFLCNRKSDIDFPVGKDGRNRFSRWEYGAITGRDAPKSSESIVLKAKFLRPLIKPTKGHAIIYADYVAQEQGIAAALSGDKQLISDYRSNEIYLNFSKEIGLIPNNGDKNLYLDEYELGKKIFNWLMNSMGTEKLSKLSRKSRAFAEKVLSLHKSRYKQYWIFVNKVRNYSQEYEVMKSPFHWKLNLNKNTSFTTISNFPIQSSGADITRLACVMCFDQEMKILSSLHDSIMIESAIEDCEKNSELLEKIMIKASEIVLDGFRLNVKIKTIKYPDRFEINSPKEKYIWNLIVDALQSPIIGGKYPHFKATV